MAQFLEGELKCLHILELKQLKRKDSTKEEVNELLEKYISSYEKEDYYRWAIIDKDSKECVGQIAYFLVDSKNHFAEIEYCIGVNYQCRGYATEALISIF